MNPRSGRVLTISEVEEAQWHPLVSAYERELSDSHEFTTFALKSRTVQAINQGRRAVSQRAGELFELFFRDVLEGADGEHVYAARCQHLLDMPIAVLAMAASTHVSRVPLDLHPSLEFERVLRMVRADRWPCPRPSEICLLIGTDLGESELLDPTNAALEVAAYDAAAVVQWAIDRQMALQSLSASNGDIRTLTWGAIWDALSGRVRRHCQIVGHVIGGGRPKLVCDDGELDLVSFEIEARNMASRGMRSPLQSVDLVACGSSGLLSHAFHSLGVDYVNSVRGPIHTGAVSRTLRDLYVCGHLDGSVPFQHAWIRALLSVREPSPAGRGIAQRDEPTKV
jgi:hypothetical protein